MKRKSGITLIALVITIIVLLILAGVSINMITGDDGIIERASQASEKTEDSTLKESEDLKQSGEYINDFVDYTNGIEHEGELDNTIAEFGRLHDNTIDLATYCVTNSVYPAAIIQRDNVSKVNFYIREDEGIYRNANMVWAARLEQEIGTSLNGLASAVDFVAFKVDDPSKAYDLKIEYVFEDGTVKYAVAESVAHVKIEFAYKLEGGANQTDVKYIQKGNTLTSVISPVTYSDGTYSYIFQKWVEEDGVTTASFENISENKKVTAIYTSQINESICFVAGTKVLTEAGLVNIEDIKTGMKVYSYNEETEEVELKEVKQTFKTNPIKDMVKVIVNGEVVESTSKHEYYVVGKGWTAAHELKEGDVLLNSANEEVKVEEVELVISNGNPVTVYNFEVEDNHNYFVGEENVLVHNAGSKC